MVLHSMASIIQSIICSIFYYIYKGGRPKAAPFCAYITNAANNALYDAAGCWLLAAAAAAAGTVAAAAGAVAAAAAAAGAVAAAAVASPIFAIFCYIISCYILLYFCYVLLCIKKYIARFLIY